jgi:hypothetical protein
MKAIVPLAGPDFVRSDGSLKALHALEGRPLLHRVLTSRPWAGGLRGDDYCFVLADRSETRDFAAGPLSDWFPESRKIFLSDFTRGAALSALAAMSAHKTADEPLVIDLADIYYESDLDPSALFASDPSVGGIALVFESDNPAYSYLATCADGHFLHAAEKEVISSNASAGTYFFASTALYLRALSHALENEAEHTYRGLFFVCPLFNGVRAAGRDVLLKPVSNVVDIKIADV